MLLHPFNFRLQSVETQANSDGMTLFVSDCGTRTRPALLQDSSSRCVHLNELDHLRFPILE